MKISPNYCRLVFYLERSPLQYLSIKIGPAMLPKEFLPQNVHHDVHTCLNVSTGPECILVYKIRHILGGKQAEIDNRWLEISKLCHVVNCLENN